jgi:hypothetical protein
MVRGGSTDETHRKRYSFSFSRKERDRAADKKWINVQPTINACNLLLVHLFYMSQ